MSAPATTTTDLAPAPEGIGRARVRLLALGILVACWLLPWPQMALDTGSAEKVEYAALTGAERTGAVGALSLLAIWGLAATAFAGRSHRGMRLGLALTEAIVALGMTTLLFLEHPWIPGGEVREAWGAIFAPLALLALLEAGTLWFQGSAHRVVAVLRAGAAIFAGGCLAVSTAWVPACVALWLAISPLLFLKVRSVRGGRRGVELLLLATAVVHGFSFRIHDAFVGVGVPAGSMYNLPFAAWGVLTAVIAVTALDGLMRPDDAADDRPASA